MYTLADLVKLARAMKLDPEEVIIQYPSDNGLGNHLTVENCTVETDLCGDVPPIFVLS